MQWYEVRQRIMEELGVGKRIAANIEQAFRRKYKGNKLAIQRVCKIWYNDSGRVTFKLEINDKYKEIAI